MAKPHGVQFPKGLREPDEWKKAVQTYLEIKMEAEKTLREEKKLRKPNPDIIKREKYRMEKAGLVEEWCKIQLTLTSEEVDEKNKEGYETQLKDTERRATDLDKASHQGEGEAEEDRDLKKT